MSLQPAHVAVDEVLALARSIEAARDFDVADGAHHVRDHRRTQALGRVRRGRCRCRGRYRCHARQGRGRCPRGPPWARSREAASDGLTRDTAEPQPHLGRTRRLARVRAAEDDVLHPLAAQTLGALLAHDPGQGVGDIALAAPVRADDSRHSLIEGELGAIGKGLETGDFETFETHGAAAQSSKRCHWGKAEPAQDVGLQALFTGQGSNVETPICRRSTAPNRARATCRRGWSRRHYCPTRAVVLARVRAAFRLRRTASARIAPAGRRR